MQPRPLGLIACACAVFALLSTAYAAWVEDWTFDEPFHLRWAERLWDEGVTERGSAERFDTKTPVMIPNVLLRRAVERVLPGHARAAKWGARAPGLVWLALTLAGVFALARQEFSAVAASIAVIGIALDPNLQAHASVATVDAAYAATTVATLLTALRFAREPSLIRGACLGLALGVALATKFTAVLLLPGVAVVIALVPPPRRRAVSLAVALGTAWLVVCAAYLFRETLVPLESVGLRAPLLASLSRAAPRLPSPLPAAFLTGLDSSLARERGLEWNIVILGERYPRGVWFYFPVAWALKTPLLLALAALLGVFSAARLREVRRGPAWRALAANLALSLAYFCLVFAVQKGLRYVLMCVPLLWLIAAPGLERLLAGKRALLAVAGVAVLSVLEQAAYLGNPLSFTNAAVQPKRDVFRLLADSNVDWGQNRDKVPGWLARRGLRAARLDPIHLLPGPNLFSVNAAAGVFDFTQHRWLRQHLEPREHLGHTHLLFEVENGEFERFMNDERQLSVAAGAPLCPGAPAETQPPGTQIPFLRETAPEPGRIWVACVSSTRGVDVGYRESSGRLSVGRLTAEGRCAADLLQDDQVVWYRAPPGTRALCAVEVPNRRAYLPYRSEGYFILRGQAASLDVRPLKTDASGAVVP